MRKLLFIVFASCLLASTIQAQQLRTPAPSPTTTVKQDFGLSTIELNYSRPAVKGRKIFGDLVPYGKVWRTGANYATTVTFGDEVTIGNTKLKAGKYGLLTIPNAGEWTVIISKQTDVTGPDGYKQSEDAARVNIPAETLPFSVESFTILISTITSSTCTLDIIWDNIIVSLPVSTEIDKKVMSQIDDLMNKDNRPYYGAAMYYMDNGKDLNKALGWFDKALEQNPSAFWVHHQRANCLAKLGKKTEALAAANKSIELAKAANNADYVALNEKLIKTLK